MCKPTRWPQSETDHTYRMPKMVYNVACCESNSLHNRTIKASLFDEFRVSKQKPTTFVEFFLGN